RATGRPAPRARPARRTDASPAPRGPTPRHTRYHLPDTDVNKVLAARYTTSAPLILTRAMLWEMEARKAAHPGTYIPYVVQAGSDRSWSGHHGDGGEYLDRCSMQRLWLAPHPVPPLPETALLQHPQQKINLLPLPPLTGPAATAPHAST